MICQNRKRKTLKKTICDNVYFRTNFEETIHTQNGLIDNIQSNTMVKIAYLHFLRIIIIIFVCLISHCRFAESRIRPDKEMPELVETIFVNIRKRAFNSLAHAWKLPKKERNAFAFRWISFRKWAFFLFFLFSFFFVWLLTQNPFPFAFVVEHCF